MSMCEPEPTVDMERQIVSFHLSWDVLCHVSFLALSDKLAGRRIRTADQALTTLARHRLEFETAAAKKLANQRAENDGSVFIGMGDLQRSMRDAVT